MNPLIPVKTASMLRDGKKVGALIINRPKSLDEAQSMISKHLSSTGIVILHTNGDVAKGLRNRKFTGVKFAKTVWRKDGGYTVILAKRQGDLDSFIRAMPNIPTGKGGVKGV